MQTSILKNPLTEITRTVDSETGEILDQEIKKQDYIANCKEEFFLIYSTLIGVFQKISTAEIRVYAFLLEHYSVNTKIVINEIIRNDIANRTKLKQGSINNTFNRLTSAEHTSHPLLYRLGRGIFQLNPRYAFKGSTSNRNNSLKAIIELGCKNC
ncbi:MAG: replication/maintenance protein RepL [Bacteroidota bacterium]|nr:replication/maintenance protein RepL [Bacteroidota bacterium]